MEEKIGSNMVLLQSQNFVRQQSASVFNFQSDTLCKVAYSRLLVSKRQEIHKKIALWYEMLSANHGYTVENSLLAHHWVRALEGNPNEDPALIHKVLDYIQISVNDAINTMYIEEAVSLLKHGLNISQLLPKADRQKSSQRFKLQLMGLPVRNLHGFTLDEIPRIRTLRTPSLDDITSPNTVPKFLSSMKQQASNRALSVAEAAMQQSSRQITLQGVLKRKTRLRWVQVYCVLQKGVLRYVLRLNAESMAIVCFLLTPF
jgi:hypothetical protein